MTQKRSLLFARTQAMYIIFVTCVINALFPTRDLGTIKFQIEVF